MIDDDAPGIIVICSELRNCETKHRDFSPRSPNVVIEECELTRGEMNGTLVASFPFLITSYFP
jgi:hypothetical protein